VSNIFDKKTPVNPSGPGALVAPILNTESWISISDGIEQMDKLSSSKITVSNRLSNSSENQDWRL